MQPCTRPRLPRCTPEVRRTAVCAGVRLHISGLKASTCQQAAQHRT